MVCVMFCLLGITRSALESWSYLLKLKLSLFVVAVAPSLRHSHNLMESVGR